MNKYLKNAFIILPVVLTATALGTYYILVDQNKKHEQNKMDNVDSKISKKRINDENEEEFFKNIDKRLLYRYIKIKNGTPFFDSDEAIAAIVKIVLSHSQYTTQDIQVIYEDSSTNELSVTFEIIDISGKTHIKTYVLNIS